MRGKFYYGQSGRASVWKRGKSQSGKGGHRLPWATPPKRSKRKRVPGLHRQNHQQGSRLGQLEPEKAPGRRAPSVITTFRTDRKPWQDGTNVPDLLSHREKRRTWAERDGPPPTACRVIDREILIPNTPWIRRKNGQHPTANEGSSKRGCPGRRERNIKLP